ncbi:MAG: DUF2891 domain-containing protein [Allorhizobium sp.]
MTTPTLDAAMAETFARIALGHVRREYPSHLMHAMLGPEDFGTPSALHPIFYGSDDWHSCVHGYWLLATLLRRFPAMDAAPAIRSLFDEMFAAEKVLGECAYFDRPSARGYERPYGWGWLLKLSAELTALDNPAWATALAPLSARIVQRFRDFLPLASYPVRVGTHYNTAFALRLAADYGTATGDDAFLELLRETALRWYGSDENCPAWGEPSGDDFLSSALIEAECMRRLMPETEFQSWFERFFPDLGQAQPQILFAPPSVSDRSDGKIAHLDGLSLSRAWCWRSLANTLAEDDPRRAVAMDAAAVHLAAGLPHVAGDYMGEHWLASFAVLALAD